MPFDYAAYDIRCSSMNEAALHKEWEKYTREISGGSTSTAISVLAAPITAGVSLAGLGLSAPRIHNARKKREIVEQHLNRLGSTHHTRKRDVVGSMAISGAVGGLTMGIAAGGADAIVATGVEHGIGVVAAHTGAIEAVSHLAVDGAMTGGEHAHSKHKYKKEQDRLRKTQSMMLGQFKHWKAEEEKCQAGAVPHQQHGIYPSVSANTSTVSLSPLPQNGLYANTNSSMLSLLPSQQSEIYSNSSANASMVSFPPPPSPQSGMYQSVSANSSLVNIVPSQRDNMYASANSSMITGPPPYQGHMYAPADSGTYNILPSSPPPQDKLCANPSPSITSLPPPPPYPSPYASPAAQAEAIARQLHAISLEEKKQVPTVLVEEVTVTSSYAELEGETGEPEMTYEDFVEMRKMWIASKRKSQVITTGVAAPVA